ncbi:prepilin peptidase [Pseudaestuariivita rosea]|uniref:prepilin peptidase n=1 Tax=Pseudaestuariivita rosea TaxID=2763263 RepID=UPI001ABBDA8D|nr:prepilin peptidase [Pseudaestuariivita rosea]
MQIFDLRHLRLPDHATLLLALLGLLTTWQFWPSLLTMHLVSGIVTGGILWLLSTVWWRISHTEALGLGDVKFGAAAAIWVGPAISLVIILAAGSALLIALVKTSMNRADLRKPLAFGPFLCVALWSVWCWFAA